MAATAFQTRARCNGMSSEPCGWTALRYEHMLGTRALGKERASFLYQRPQRLEAQRRCAIA